jgi:hypothetical protein
MILGDVLTLFALWLTNGKNRAADIAFGKMLADGAKPV